ERLHREARQCQRLCPPYKLCLRKKKTLSARRQECRPDRAHLALGCIAFGLRRALRCGRLGRLERSRSRSGLALGRWARLRRRADRPALRIGLRLRERAGALLVHHDITALDGLVVKLLERVGPGLTGRLAAAARVEGLAIGKRI